jgi:predicted transcriptional regulator
VQYRSRNDITASILEIAKDSAIKTKIMYKAFLSYPQLKEYLALLQENDMLDYDERERTYSTTAKGTKFLDMYTRLDSMIPRANMLTKVLEK